MIYPVYVEDETRLPPDLLIPIALAGAVYILTGNAIISGLLLLIPGALQLIRYGGG